MARHAGKLLLLPALLLSALFLGAPMVTLVVDSFTVADQGTQFSLENYSSILGDSYYWEVIFRTLRVSVFTTALTLLLGYPSALFLYFSQGRWRRVFLFIIVSPLFVSVIVRTYGWIILLSPNGPITAVLPEWFRPRMLYTEGAIVVALAHIYLPFMVLALNAALVKVDRRLLTAAASLGATSWQMFRDILFPLSLPGMLSGCVIVFSISTTAFSTPILIGGAARKTLAYLIYQQNLLLANWHMGAALAFVLLAFTIIIVRGITWLTSRGSAAEAA